MASAKKSQNEGDNKKKKKGNEAIEITKTPKQEKEKEKEKLKKKKKNNNIANGTRSESSDVVVIPSSSCGSQEDEEELKNRSNKSSNNKTKKSNKRKVKAEDDNGGGEDETMFRFPMARIKRIMKSEDRSLQLSQDVVFLVNKATEKFIEQFCEDAYDCSVRDRKKSLGYKHLSSVVSEQRRLDFLSDFVPEKLKAVDALAQRKTLETKQG